MVRAKLRIANVGVSGHGGEEDESDAENTR
jgi:hypothetical protein